MVNITSVNLLGLATSIQYGMQLASLPASTNTSVGFISYSDTFVNDILGPNVSSQLIANETWEAFHEGGVYSQATKSLYVSSNWAKNFSNPINVTILDLATNAISSVRYPNLASPNGLIAYYPLGTPANSSANQQILFCDEGDLTNPSQLTLLNPATNTTTVLLNNFLGRNFSSLNDAKQHPHTHDIWFTDSNYGYWQFFGPAPTIPLQVYRYSPSTGVVQAVADGFVAPNGIEFSPDFKTVYVTDTGAQEYTTNFTRPATIYAYDLMKNKMLGNRRLFAYSDVGFPDGIHTDTKGNVYASCGDGVHVWNDDGVLLAKFVVSGGSNNFAFIPGGMIIFNGRKAYKVSGLKVEGREVRRDFGLH
ncbi:hypothetical protein MBLNU457_g2569t1 [Dothideomycetes sp. NU457]